MNFKRNSFDLRVVSPAWLLLGNLAVLVTIVLGSSVFIQGTYERRLPNGMITVRVGSQLFTGRPANGGAFV